MLKKQPLLQYLQGNYRNPSEPTIAIVPAKYYSGRRDVTVHTVNA